jgi:molybdopterin converting factor small subunit
VRIPSALTPFTEGCSVFQVSRGTVGEVFEELFAKYPNLRSKVLDDRGALRTHLRVFVEGQLADLTTPVREGFEIVILPAVAGGEGPGYPSITKVIVNLSATEAQVGEPWIWRLSRDFNVRVNILKANVDEDFGWVQISLEGPLEEVQRAIAWLHTTGLAVEPLERSVGA